MNSNVKQVGEQVSRLTERNRQREMTETSNVERMLEMMLTMRQDEQRREEKREQEERDKEARREERQLELLAQLKEAQPAVPQQVTINQHKLPLMTKEDDLEIFVRQLEVALRTERIEQGKWKQSLLSQLTLEAKERVWTC